MSDPDARSVVYSSDRGHRTWATVPVAVAAVALTLFAAGALATLTASAGAATSSPARAPVLTPGSRYLALGDSVTFGYQEPQVVPAPDYANASSFLGYPEQLGAELHLAVTNPACPGETSASLINSSAQSNGCENAYRKGFPLHVRYRGAQLAYAVSYLRTHRDVRLVSVMVGANDLFLCQSTTRDGCVAGAEQRATLARLARNVRLILSAVRNTAHYRGQLAIVNYYSLNYASPFLSGLSAALNRTADSVATPFQVVIADGYDELKTAALRFGEDTCKAGLLTLLGSPGNCGVHPSYAGQALLAQALEKAIRL